MVGLVGSSNNPVSGMAIATLLVSTLLLRATGDIGAHGMTAAIAIGSIICIVAAISGDTSQDLKTGYILGATPKKQQIGEVIGVFASALAIGGTLYLLDAAWGFGSPELGAPQATLMKMIIEGVMEGNLPWALVFTGVFIAIVVEVVGLPVLPFAIGIYLPVQLNACIMVGGLVRLLIEKMKMDETKKTGAITDGTLFCSGMIAGEGLVGILLAFLAIIPVGDATLADKIVISLGLPSFVSDILGLVVLALIVISVLKFSLWKKSKSGK
jgi:putative OPT family oligopeptide transporter